MGSKEKQRTVPAERPNDLRRIIDKCSYCLGLVYEDQQYVWSGERVWHKDCYRELVDREET